jgi:adenylate kinase family enzyme
LVKYTYEKFTKEYGLCHLSYRQVIEDCKLKTNPDSKYLQDCENKKELPSSEFIIYLLRKKIEKRDYLGNFLVTGFPRNINDAILWEKTFGWEVGVETYIHFCVS